MSKVQYKVPVFITINGKKICYLIEYHRLVKLRKLGMNDSEILADLMVDKEAA
ncbi:hypothetical protein PQE20_17920 [Vibrio harveyi]|uniref:hypothetical protein n=1 Tax=Vibrio harveyi TaxID=669 RepID=UPI00234D356F|nr:hypothetical protein [Vibrio harveyi]WCP83297.1 hypothetical protein PQE20_17920 [Vibrio harveyi]